MALKKKSDAKSPAFEESPDNAVVPATQGVSTATRGASNRASPDPGTPVAIHASPVTAAAGAQSLSGGPDFGIDNSKVPTAAGAADAGAMTALALMSISGLLELRADIDALLPPTSLAEINLEEELVLQFHAAKDLQARVMGSRAEAANYQASVLNAVTNVLKQVVDMQEILHRTENVKSIEFAIERAMAAESMEVKTKFLERYKQALAEAAAPKKREKVA